MKRVITYWLLTFLLILSTSPIARGEDSSHAETSQEKAEKGDATEINKQLTNPVSELWSIEFQQNNYRISPGIPFDQGERWSSNLLFQPVLPVAFTPEWNRKLPRQVNSLKLDSPAVLLGK